MKEKNLSNDQGIHRIALVGVMTAIICICGPLAMPLPGGVPISLTNLAILLAVYLLGMKNGTLSCGIYILLGLVGLPVFSGYMGGLTKLAGPTGGYIIGFVVMALISGWFNEQFKGKYGLQTLGMGLGVAADYVFGTIWFIAQTQMPLMEALSVCVLPFLIGDALKIAAVIIVGPALRKALVGARVLVA